MVFLYVLETTRLRQILSRINSVIRSSQIVLSILLIIHFIFDRKSLSLLGCLLLVPVGKSEVLCQLSCEVGSTPVFEMSYSKALRSKSIKRALVNSKFHLDVRIIIIYLAFLNCG